MCLFWLLNKSGSTYLNDNVYMLYNYMDAVCITLKTETQERNTIYHFHELLHGFVLLCTTYTYNTLLDTLMYVLGT